jgi:hypothetical protein
VIVSSAKKHPRVEPGGRNALVKIKTHHAKEWCKIITSKYNRSGSVQRSHTSISFNTSVYNCSTIHGISQWGKHIDEIRPTCKFKVERGNRAIKKFEKI